MVSAFAHDIKPAPRSFAEVFVNLRDFVEHAEGGHFAAWEQPAAYAADLDRAVRGQAPTRYSPPHDSASDGPNSAAGV